MKNISLFIFLVFISLSLQAAPKWTELENYTFDQYNQDFQKNYTKGTYDYNSKKEYFDRKLKEIIAFNKEDHSYKKGVNAWTDIDKNEFQKTRLGRSKVPYVSSKAQYNRQLFLNPKGIAITDQEFNALPKSIDWREKNVVSPVKDQGKCGSCWAFTSVAVIESHAAIATGHLKTLSTEQLVTCMTNSLECGGSGGCHGAISELAFNYVQLFGLTSEYKYPYRSYQGNAHKCTHDQKIASAEVTIDGYLKLPANSYRHLMKAIATVGPVAVNVDASLWKEYEEGVYSGCDQNLYDINHLVTLVGYGSDEKLGDYWLIRNSWGTKWGESGYMKLKREAEASCGTDYQPFNGSICKRQNEVQKVCGMCGILFDSSYPLGVNVIG